MTAAVTLGGDRGAASLTVVVAQREGRAAPRHAASARPDVERVDHVR